MTSGTQMLGLVAVVAASGLAQACTFPAPSKEYACEVDTDCDPERVCSSTKYCVLRSAMEVDAGLPDAVPDSTPIDADPFEATKLACIAAGYTLEPSTGGYYRKVTTNATWATATTDCNNDVAGATHVITLSTDAEVTFQKSLTGAWIGWTDRPTEGMWHATTAEDAAATLNYAMYWANNRPDGSNRENCAIWRNANPMGIDDVECDQSHPYICECDGRPPL